MITGTGICSRELKHYLDLLPALVTNTCFSSVWCSFKKKTKQNKHIYRFMSRCRPITPKKKCMQSFVWIFHFRTCGPVCCIHILPSTALTWSAAWHVPAACINNEGLARVALAKYGICFSPMQRMQLSTLPLRLAVKTEGHWRWGRDSNPRNFNCICISVCKKIRLFLKAT